MTTNERFKAAAKVITNLPKNGSYQPSEELMLRFYSYYKQATSGPCKSSKPAFWQLVKKARWEAWAQLGNMSQKDAMSRYIEELKGIIETMSYNEDVADFLDRVDLFHERTPERDPDTLEQTQLHTDSSLSDTSEETLLWRDEDSVNDVDSYVQESEADDEFIDSVEYAHDSFQREFLKNCVNEKQSEFEGFDNRNDFCFESASHDVNFVQCTDASKGVEMIFNRDMNKNTEYNPERLNLEFMNQIMITLKDLQENLNQVIHRIGSIEGKMQKTKKRTVKAYFDKSSVGS
ncbi:acyl-CoA-binding domain-containing protein 5-like [Copidosoma floridanum]|uniref:acyl-CoA-binding domain-containing protein 5-like n=1 Tax=Copidosoma floridanum TaxID=29053 RepID=UPI0006C9C397|nr:acyl-CoA-binding domain-containing protein 5-like [Copidosoma floridanum]XP_014206314.1 acyl-CoA-binding domain-containing protein 5-like [Copidosoma floridanum]